MNEKVKELIYDWRSGSQRMGTHGVGLLVSEIERLEQENIKLRQWSDEYPDSVIQNLHDENKAKGKRIEEIESDLEEWRKERETLYQRITELESKWLFKQP